MIRRPRGDDQVLKSPGQMGGRVRGVLGEGNKTDKSVYLDLRDNVSTRDDDGDHASTKRKRRERSKDEDRQARLLLQSLKSGMAGVAGVPGCLRALGRMHKWAVIALSQPLEAHPVGFPG